MPPRPKKKTGEVQTAPGHALIKVRIGNRTYDAVRDGRCQTCMHPARMEIEEKVVQGIGYRPIAEQYSETRWTNADGTTITLPKITWTSILGHCTSRHLPVEMAAYQQILEERAREMGQKYEEMTSSVVDGFVFSKQVLAATQMALATGELKPDIKDGLAAAKLIKEMEDSAQGSVETEAWSQAMTIFFETAQKFMPPDMWAHFGASLAGNPILAAIQNRLNGTQDDTVDAEVVGTEGK